MVTLLLVFGTIHSCVSQYTSGKCIRDLLGNWRWINVCDRDVVYQTTDGSWHEILTTNWKNATNIVERYRYPIFVERDLQDPPTDCVRVLGSDRLANACRCPVLVQWIQVCSIPDRTPTLDSGFVVVAPLREGESSNIINITNNGACSTPNHQIYSYVGAQRLQC